MLKTFIRTTACLTVSAAAFIVLTKMDATAAKPRSPSGPETSQPKPAPSKPAPPPTTQPAPKLTVASVSPPPGAVPSTAATTTKGKADRDSAVTVPDWKGKRLSVVQREARKLGLTIAAVDGTGESIPSEEASDYRVRKQLTNAGTAVEPGTEVQLRVRMIAEAAMGY
jgi:hypothetical protein